MMASKLSNPDAPVGTTEGEYPQGSPLLLLPFQKLEEALLEPILNKMLDIVEMNYDCCEGTKASSVYVDCAMPFQYYPEVKEIPSTFTLANKPEPKTGFLKKKKEENPMRYDSVNLNPTVTVAAPVSDAATAREYLNKRIYDIRCERVNREFYKLFNLGVSTRPKSYKDLIEKITKGQFKLDEKRTKKIDAYIEADDFYGSYDDGIIWLADVMPDRYGFDAAIKAFDKLVQAAKDTVAVGTPAEGLKAVQALEDWQPTGKAN